MQVFVTGGTGFIGSAVVQELLAGGHGVLALARSESSAEALRVAGCAVHRGDLEDLGALRAGAEAADAVAHFGFIHDFSRFAEVCAIDRRAIEAIGGALSGTRKPLVAASGTALVAPGRLAREDDRPSFTPEQMPRVASALALESLRADGVVAVELRLPPVVHGEGGDHGFVPMLRGIALEKGTSAMVGEGKNRWSAVHRLDAARLCRHALESPDLDRMHAVAEEELPFHRVATLLGERLGLPVSSVSEEGAEAHFGWFAPFAQLDCPASSQLTRARYDWRPSHPTLRADLESGVYDE